MKNIMAVGRKALNAVSYHSTESLSRQIIAGHENTDDVSTLVNELLALQNPDGGFGELADFDSTVLNTAFALEALAMAAASETQTIERALTFLTQHQNPDGSFVLNAVNESAIYVTALASSALQRFLFNAKILPYVEAANDYLYKNQLEGGGWETDWETAIALLAVSSATADTRFYKPAAQVLRTHQDNKGSWGNDAYTTALALRALQYVKRIQFPVEPDKGILTGQVIDDNSGLPLAKVAVTLSPLAETTAQTESDGSFNLTGLEPGSYTLKYQLAGYQEASQEASVSKGQFAELGTVRLAPLPDVGIISGTLTDTTTGQPLSGVLVEVTGAVTASALTDEQGYYAIVSPPGPVTVSATLSGYDTLSGTGTVTRGVTLSFSPAINPTGTTPSNPEITVKGLIQDSETGTPLTDAVITIIGTEHSGQTDDSGAFAIPGVTPGELNIKIAIKGYQTGLFTVLAPPGGMVDLGTTHLPKTVAAATTTLIGQVKDANTGEPLEGANVSIETLESALTAENGNYRLEDIDIKAFKITASALNYLSTNYNLNLSGSGVVTFDFNLIPAAESGLEIASISSDQTSYEALTGALLELVLNNKEDSAQEIRFLLKVLNEQGELVEQFSPVINNVVSVEANGQLNTTVEWQTARHLPGDYEVIVQAYQTETGQLLAERSTQVVIQPTKRIGGHVAFGPPIAQLAAKKPIKLTAQIANQGNQNVESTTVTATITLKNKGYQQQRSEVNIESFVQENELVKSPRGSDFDAAGNLYVANYSKHTVLKVTPEGEVSEFATDLHYPIDVDFDQFGNLYVLSYYSYYNKGLVRLGADGSRREFKLVNVSYSRALEVLDDGRILIAGGNTLYEVRIEENATQLNATQIIKGGLSAPVGLAEDSRGNLFIADKTGNAIVKFANGKLSTFASNIKQPYGMTIDEQDNLYVTSFQDNSLIKITPDGTMTTITSGLEGPYDVKIANDGNFVVSNYNSHEVLTITPEGDVSVLVQATLHAPTALTYDATGNLYIGNWLRRNIVKLDTDGVATVVDSNAGYPRDILKAQDGNLYWLASNYLNKIGPDDSTKTTLTTKLNYPYALINAPDGNGFWVSEYSGHRISRVSTTGEITAYTTETSFIQPRSIRTDTQGNLYILSDNGYITQFTESGKISRVVSELHYPRGLAIDSQGNLYVSEYYNKRILRIDKTGNIEIVADKLSFYPHALAVTSQNDILVAKWRGDTVYLIKEGQVSEYAKLENSDIGFDMLVDSFDNLWISQYYQHRVLKLSPDGTETPYKLINRRYYPQSLFPDGAGGVWVGAYQSIQHIDKQGKITEKLYQEAVYGQNIRGLAFDKTGQLWTADANTGVLSLLTADDTVDKRFASLYYPKGLAWVDNALIVANTSRKAAILRITSPDALPEIILDGSYEQVERIDSQSVLLSNASSVSRFDLGTGSVSQVTSGFSDIEALTKGSDGHFVVADYYSSRNALAFYDSDGTLQDRFIGLVNPKGLLFDSNGQLLVSNAFPNGVSKVSEEGNLEPFSSITSVESMWLEEDGQILVSRSGQIRRLSKTGELLKSYQVPSYSLKGLLRNAEGLWIASDNQGALLKMEADGSYQKMASGLYNARDIEADGKETIHIADSTRGVVTRLNEDSATRFMQSTVKCA